jgi:hypothetical protein
MNYLSISFPGSPGTTLPSYIPKGGLGALEIFLQRFMVIFLFTGICLVTIYIVWGGIQWITAEGDKTKLASARSKVTWAIIGFIILLLSYTIVNAIGFLFRVNLLKLT